MKCIKSQHLLDGDYASVTEKGISVYCIKRSAIAWLEEDSIVIPFDNIMTLQQELTPMLRYTVYIGG